MITAYGPNVPAIVTTTPNPNDIAMNMDREMILINLRLTFRRELREAMRELLECGRNLCI